MQRKDGERIAYAGKPLIPELTELWMKAFGDEREYVEFYFDHRFREEYMLVYLVDEKPVSMISMLPAVMYTDGKRGFRGKEPVVCGGKQEIRYIYAVATDPAHRRKGYAKALIQAGQRQLHVPFVLEPATDKLRAYYQGMGFKEAFRVNEEELLLPAMQAAELRTPQRYWLLTAAPAEYKQIRDEKLFGAGYVEWNEEAISYALRENDFCGGYAYKVLHEETEDILLYREERGCLNIIETTLSNEDIFGVVRRLQLQPEQILVRRPVTKAERAENERSFGMILGAQGIGNGYLNLTLE